MHVGHIIGRRDGIVVITLVSHLCGPGSGHEWVKLVVDSLLCSERFSPLLKNQHFQIPIDRIQALPENHFRVSGASCVNINNIHNLHLWTTAWMIAINSYNYSDESNRSNLF